MDVVAHLSGLVAIDAVFPPFQIAFDQVTQETMQFHPAVVRTRQAAAAQASGGHPGRRRSYSWTIRSAAALEAPKSEWRH